ncbi:serine carboxypeptidase-like 17 [Rutidosis leptorrhynchoides]|uniref:serine carboxypeptidase-like 17 n=1 Tax=Rutidosis leptorrhynchoides TaxID=125765 RepID=UPI003A996F01
MHKNGVMYLELFLLACSTLVASRSIVKTLPGFHGHLPFKLETGYIGIGEEEDVQLFYYFVESEGNPEKDPLIIWLAGGPGCTTLHAFFFEIGPMQIQYGKYIHNVPALQVDPNSWTKVANIIYVDAPTLTGYSYTRTLEAARSSDTLSASQTVEFIRKFVRDHPRFSNNPMYVTGISYSGIVIPMVTEELYKGNEEGLEPNINIKGYMAGNPLTDESGDRNSRFEYAYHVALIPKDLFESTKKNCNGEFVKANSKNLLCTSNLVEVDKRVKDINIQSILDHNCQEATSLLKSLYQIKENQICPEANPIKMVLQHSSANSTHRCREDYYNYATIWAKDKRVMRALGVHEGMVKEFRLCNLDMRYSSSKSSMPLYEFDVLSSVIYHKMLTKRNCRALIFSGDHDLMVPYIGTHNWIKSLNLTITDSNWEAWYSNDEVGGYKTTYARDNYSLVFATVKGAGHTAPEFKHKECFEMVKKWFAYESI